MKILFARHGESEANVQRIISNRNLPHYLTQNGIFQADTLAKIMVSVYDVKMVGTSPIPRAKETAAIVADRLGLSISIYPALREFDCGLMEGRHDEEAWVAHKAVIQAWDEDQDFDRRIQPDGESFNEIKSRFLPFVTRLIENNRNLAGDILLISHGGLLHQMLPLVLVNIDRAFTKKHPIGNCELIITVPQCGQLVCSDWAGVKLT